MRSVKQARASCSECILSKLPNASLTSSGLVLLEREDDEVELLVANEVGCFDASIHPSLRESQVIPMVTLTTHRLVFHRHPQEGDARSIHLRHIVKTEASAVMLLSLSSSPHIIIHSDAMGSYGLIFRHKRDRDTWFAAIDKAIERRGWEDSTKLNLKNSILLETRTRSVGVGVEAIISRNHQSHEHAKKVAHEAFQIRSARSSSSQKSLSEHDKQGLVEKLFTEASELVSIIHKYITTIENHNQQQLKQTQNLSEKTESEDVDENSMNHLVEMLHEMGMTTALSKSQTRSKYSSSQSSDFYYTTLARQLTDFLLSRNRLKNAGGILSVTDIYCLFNRARGAHTISPQDLLQACRELQTLTLGISLRVFPSGVMVLQEDALMDDMVIIQKIYSLLWSKQGFSNDSTSSLSPTRAISSMDISRTLNVAPLLAQELLLIVEKAGYICRDFTMEQGILFFPNCFVSSTSKDCITFKNLETTL